MGIDTGWGIVQGLDYNDWIKVLKKLKPEEVSEDEDVDMYDIFHEFAEYNGLESLSPYYDAPPEDRVYGIIIIDSDYSQVIDLDEIKSQAKIAYDDLFERFGVVTETLGSQNIW